MSFINGFKKTSGVANALGRVGGWALKNPGKAIAGVTALNVGGNLAQGKGLRQSLSSPLSAPNYQEKTSHVDDKYHNERMEREDAEAETNEGEREKKQESKKKRSKLIAEISN